MGQKGQRDQKGQMDHKGLIGSICAILQVIPINFKKGQKNKSEYQRLLKHAYKQEMPKDIREINASLLGTILR